ncbi:MAG: type II toxin-antitoxin system PemK/MazF family toxin [Acidobacteriia bacterium]|nr:type II toxin-antitoxin system PemK/MazF family toxin [Terriglobia bacterium]
MKRGDIYRVHRPGDDPKQHRCFAVVSRQALIESRFSTVVCAPIFTLGQALASQVAIGPDEGMKHESWIKCDNLASVRKAELTQFVGSLSRSKLADLDDALKVALGVE